MPLAHRRMRIAGIAVAALLAVAGCGPASSTETDMAPQQPTASPPSTRASSVQPKDPEPRRDGPVTLAFAGDVHFAGRNAALLENPRTAFGPISKTLSAADFAMVNLETAILTGQAEPEPKAFTFSAPPSAFTALRAAGIDIATMANNHGVDFGRAGLTQTLHAIEKSGFPVVGIGANAAEAYAPYTTSIGDTTIAFLGVSHLIDPTYLNWTATETSGGIASTKNMNRLLSSVAKAEKRADVVVVYVHWGDAANECPTPRMRRLAETLAQAGVDAIVGTHAHLLLGAGYLGDTYVAYGLGNFLWWRNDAFSDDTGVLTLTVEHGQVTDATFTPALIDSNGRPQPVTGEAKERKQDAFRQLRSCTNLTAEPT